MAKRTQRPANEQVALNASLSVSPEAISKVDMSTLTTTISLPKIEGVSMESYELEQVGQDLEPNNPVPFTPIPDNKVGKSTDAKAARLAKATKVSKAAEPAKATKADSGPVKPAASKVEPFQVKRWVLGGLETICFLSDLMPLDETGLHAANIAMREIVPTNVENLRMAYRNPDTIVPAIRVVYTNRLKFVPFDGNHRWMAQCKNLMENLGLPCDTPAEVKTSSGDPHYIEALKETTIAIEITNDVGGLPVTNRDLIELAFTANFQHGLPASTYGRSSYAIWWMEDVVERTGKTYHGIQSDACRVAGIKVPTLSKALTRAQDAANKKAKQPVDLTFLPETDRAVLGEIIDMNDRREAKDVLSQTCKRLIATAKAISELFEDEASAYGYMSQFVLTAEDKGAMGNLFGILSYGFDLSEDLEDLEEDEALEVEE